MKTAESFWLAPPAERPLARELGDVRVWVIAGTRLAGLQGAHPTIAAGLLQHSTATDDPLKRLNGTLSYAMRMLFGHDQEVTAAEIREMHRDIKGVRSDGNAYHAWNREAWAWVHLTSMESLIHASEVVCGPLDPDEVEAMYQDTCAVGAMYGIRDEDMPDDVASLHGYVEDGIRTKLCMSEDTEEMRAAVHGLQMGPLLRLPTRANRALARIAQPPMNVLLYGSFPAPLRELWGVEWKRRHEIAYRGVIRSLRSASVLPDRLLMFPDAYRALREKRSHALTN